MEKEKISVLMSVYKNDNPLYFDESLESILGQTLLPDEIVLIQDGDVSVEIENIIEKYNNIFPNILLYKNDNNIGLGLSLRKGICYCNNEYIFRMDSDDISNKYRFEKQIVYLKSGFDVVSSNYYAFEGNIKNIIAKRFLPEKDEFIKKQAKYKSPLCHAVVAYKKSKVLEAGNYMECDKYEDYHLWVRMIKMNNKFYNIQEPLLYVRVSDQQMQRRGGLIYLKNEIKVHYYFYKIGFLKKRNLIFNVSSRIIIRLVPNRIRKLFQIIIWKYT
jgi:glycosyltransferase involved in cell wall biosynthesis